MTSHSKCQDANLGADLSRARPARDAGRSLLGGILAALDGWVAAIFLWQSVSRTVRQLSALSDAQLKNRGLERSGIVARVYEEALAEQERRR